MDTAVNVASPSALLTRRIVKIASKFTELMDSLSLNIRPCVFVGFGESKPTKNAAALLGWSYDWSDKGEDPPPWSDWGDKTDDEP